MAKPLPNHLFVKSDGGRNQHGFAENKDCTVRALALAACVGYKEAHELLAAHGRKQGKGFKMRDFLNSRTEILGARVTKLTVRRQRVTTLIPNLKGIFIVRVSGHVFTVCDGVAHDANPYLAGCIVTDVWQFA